MFIQHSVNPDCLFNTQSRVLQTDWFKLEINEEVTLNININTWDFYIDSKEDIGRCTIQKLDSHGIIAWNVNSHGNINLNPELSGRIFTLNLRILLRDSIMRCALPKGTIMIYTKVSGFRFQGGKFGKVFINI